MFASFVVGWLPEGLPLRVCSSLKVNLDLCFYWQIAVFRARPSFKELLEKIPVPDRNVIQHVERHDVCLNDPWSKTRTWLMPSVYY